MHETDERCLECSLVCLRHLQTKKEEVDKLGDAGRGLTESFTGAAPMLRK